jgi:hypothetical protein
MEWSKKESQFERVDEASVICDIIISLLSGYQKYFNEIPKNIILGRTELYILSNSLYFYIDADGQMSFHGIPVVESHQKSIIGLTPNYRETHWYQIKS